MTANAWIKKHREHVGKVMVRIDFQKFMKDHSVTVEELKNLLKYTMPGIISLLECGTIKPKVYNLLKVYYRDLDKYAKTEGVKNNGTAKRKTK
jgi:hypothetical protein